MDRTAPLALPARWAPVPSPVPPAGLGDLRELGEPWAASAWHHAVAMASGWRGEPVAPSGWGYPPPTAYRAMPAPRPPMPQPMPQPARPAPRWFPTPPLGVAPA